MMYQTTTKKSVKKAVKSATPEKKAVSKGPTIAELKKENEQLKDKISQQEAVIDTQVKRIIKLKKKLKGK